MATLPLVSTPSIESNKSPEPYRSIEKALTVAINRALEECEERSKAFQSLKICTQQLAPCRTLTDIGSVTCLTSHRSKEGTLVIFGTGKGELLAVYPFEDQNAIIRNIAGSGAEECDESIVALASASSTDSVAMVASLLPSRLEIRRFALRGEEPIVTPLGHVSIDKEAGPSLTLQSSVGIHPSLDFIAVGGPGPELLLFEVPSPLRKALSQDEVADFEPSLLPSILSLTEATSRSFLQDPGILGKTVFEFVREDRYQSGNAIQKPKEGGHRAYIWWEGSNRLGLFNISKKEGSTGGEEVGFSSEMHVCGDWILPDAVTCSDVSQDGDWIAFGMENGKVLVWDVAEGNAKMLSCSIGSIVVGVKLQVCEGAPCVSTVGAEGQFLLTDIQRNNIILSKYIHLDIVEVHWMAFNNHNSVPMIYCRDGAWAIFDDARNLTQMERPYELTGFKADSTSRLFLASERCGWFFVGMKKKGEVNGVSDSSDTPELDEHKEATNSDHQSENEPEASSIDLPTILAYDLSSVPTIRWPKEPKHGRGEDGVRLVGFATNLNNLKHSNRMNKAQKDAVAEVNQRLSQSKDHDPKRKLGLLRTRLGGDSVGLAHLG